VKSQRTAFDQVFSSAQLLVKESEAIKHKKGLYEAVRTRVDQKEMERNVPGSIEVLTKASAPTEPAKDRRLILSILALFGGLGAGAGVCFLRLSTAQTIHEPDDLGQTAATPFLGQLPFIQNKAKTPVEEDERLLESVRMLRTALLQRIDYQRGSIVQITSAEPGAGKSTVAIMLARSLAQCGKKVLLVDADLRNPTFASRFGVSAEPGLIGALTGKTDAEAIIGTDTPLLSILPSGRAGRAADAELVANGVLSACLQRWQQSYDLVLLDSPPLLPVADARILAQKADGSIMVVRERLSRRAGVFEAMSFLQIAGGKLLGVVFIGSGGRGKYPEYSYQYNYGKPVSEPADQPGDQPDEHRA
jgi:receptor protein-tyrosine kinase